MDRMEQCLGLTKIIPGGRDQWRGLSNKQNPLNHRPYVLWVIEAGFDILFTFVNVRNFS